MKVSMVLASEHEGGLEKHVRELAHELVQQGVEVVVIAPTVFLDTLNHSVEKRAINGKQSRLNPCLLWSLYHHLKTVNSDIIHAHANKAASMVGRLKRFFTTPIVATLHNLKKGKRQDFLAFQHIICVSHHINQGFSADQQVTVIYNGIHPPLYQKIDLKTLYNLPNDQPVICAIGRLVDAKGFDVLLDAVNGLAVSVIIAGEGPERLALEQKIATLNSQTTVKLIGHRRDVHDLIHSADALVISSRREGFPYVFVEAVMCQAKVLSTNVPVAEVLPAELIVPINDAKALRDRLSDLLAQPHAWDALMQPVRQLVTKELQCTAMTQKTIQKYEAMYYQHKAQSAVCKQKKFW